MPRSFPLTRILASHLIAFAIVMVTNTSSSLAQTAPCPVSGGNTAADTWFGQKVWATIGQNECLKCHRTDGDASDSRFILRDPTTSPREELAAVLRHNRDAFATMAGQSHEGRSLLVVKATGGLDHGGKEVVAPDSTGAKILEEFAQRQSAAKPNEPRAMEPDRPFFDGVAMCSDLQLLRKATLSLAGRLPTKEERDLVKSGGLNAVAGILDNVLREDAFFERLREGFNDIFLTQGVDGNPDQTVLSYEHFEKTRGWYQHDR